MANYNEKDASRINDLTHEISYVEPMSPGRYIATRFTSLKPVMDRAPNPFAALRLLNRRQWAQFFIGFFAWTWDAFDFFTVSLTITPLSETFHVSTVDITWGITLVLMLRSVGSIIFGIAADRYGRKWPFIANLVLFIVLELATGFCNTQQQFLGVRAVYGIAMGGLYGNAAATALEDCPSPARGIVSGMLQQGYAFGYLLAAAFTRGLVNTTSHGWRPLFWFGACPPVLIITARLFMGETQEFERRRAVREAQPNVEKAFAREAGVALKNHWLLLCYLVFLMAGFNFMSHGSQDLYPTMLTNQYEFSATAVTLTQVVANLGAITGGILVGYSSQIFGRRISIIVICVIGGALLYPYTYTSSKAVMAVAFFEQFCVQGAWGVIPVHLMELSPGSIRTFVVGTSYQLGNLASSASSTIEAKLGENYPLPSLKSHGKITKRYQYGKVICIFMGAVFAYVILMTIIGPEKKNATFDTERDHDLQEAVHMDRADVHRQLAGKGADGHTEDGKTGVDRFETV